MRMSQEERETLNNISRDIGFMKRWWPIIGSAATFLIFIMGLTWKLNDYTKTFAKQDDYIKAVKTIEALNSKLDKLAVLDSIHYVNNQQSINDLKIDKRVVVRNVTQRRDKFGNIIYEPYN